MTADEEVELTGPLTLRPSFSANEIDSYVIARTGRVSTAGDPIAAAYPEYRKPQQRSSRLLSARTLSTPT